MTRLPLLCLAFASACATNTNDIVVQLAPEVVSSLDGTLSVHTITLDDRDPAPKQAVSITVTYTDRNGTDHMIAPVSGTSDEKGVFDTQITGLTWDGTGTVTASSGASVESTVTFAVLDRTPPVVTIMPPAQVRVGTDITVNVHVTDEIGISQVYFETSNVQNNGNRQRSTVVASGSTDATIPFDFQVPDGTQGQMITLYALGADLSGNEAAAQPVTVTVMP